MLGKLSIIGVVAAILMIPTALFAQMGGSVNPGVVVSIVRPPQSSADDGQGWTNFSSG
jgi:hypothetical protein